MIVVEHFLCTRIVETSSCRRRQRKIVDAVTQILFELAHRDRIFGTYAMDVAMTEPPSRRRATRYDRRENNERLLVAALAVFDEEGIGAPMNTVAVRSGLSAATLYRHFATRDDLIVALYDRQSAELTAVMREALTHDDADPAKRIEHLLLESTRSLIAHPCSPALSARGLQLFPERRSDPELVAKLNALVDDGKHAGCLADDVTAVDLVMIPTTLTALSGYERIGRADVWKRQLDIMRRGLAPRPAL